MAVVTFPSARSALAPAPARETIVAGIRANRLVVHYQPLIPLIPGIPPIDEALVRLRTAGGTLLPPAAFLPTIMHDTAIVELGEHVLFEALGVLARRRRNDTSGLAPRVSVNVAAAQFDGTLPATVRSMLAEHQLPADALVLEVSEGDAVGEHAKRDLEDLLALGVSVSIDDYGSGMSHLARLRDLPFDQLKTDRSLLTDADGAPSATALDAAVLSSVVALAGALNVHCVIEGIETPAQLELARNVGAHYGQGFLLGRPCPADRAELYGQPA